MKRDYQICSRTGLRFRVRRQSSWWRSGGTGFRASVEISIDNPRCYSTFLECQILWAATRFNSFEFSIGDTLRVYNYMILGHPRHGILDLDSAREIAAAEGEAWISQHRSLIESHLADREYRFMQWETWKQDRSFKHAFDNLFSCYESVAPFRETVQSDIRDYLRRRNRHDLVDDIGKITALGVYLVEELAVYQLQAEARATVNIYPGSEMRVFKNMASFRDVPNFPASLLNRHFLYLDFAQEPAWENKPAEAEVARHEAP